MAIWRFSLGLVAAAMLLLAARPLAAASLTPCPPDCPMMMTMMSDGPSTHATQPGSTRGNQPMDGEQCKFGVGCLAQGAPVPEPPIAVAMPMDFSTVTHSVAMSGRLPSLVRAPHLRPPIAT